MATSSIHIATGGNGYFAHNSRESHTVNAIFDDEQNYCSCTNGEAFKIYKEELSSRTNAYLENNPTRKKLHEKTITHLSAIVNFNKEHTEKDIQKVCKYLEKTFDTKVIQFAMHRDEGHINENGEKVKNYHAHIEFMGLDSKGNSIRRKLDKKALIELQTQTAKLLKMERGTESVYTKEEYEKITKGLLKKEDYADKKEYNKAFNEKAKELGIYRDKKAKRLETYDFKKHKVMESKDLLATKKQLQEANNQLRAYMQENGAKRTDYAPLEAEKKLLEEKLKEKTLTEKELLEKFQKLEETFKTTLAQKDKFLGNLQEIGKEVAKEVPIKTISEIPDAVKEVLNQNKSLQALKSDLEYKVTDLEEKINSSSNMTAPQPPKDVQEEFEMIKQEEFEEKEIKKGLFGGSEKIKFLKNEDNFLKKTWNLIASKYEDLRVKYNNLLSKFNEVVREKDSLATENKALKKEIGELKQERSSIIQIEKNDLALEKLIENIEDEETNESESSLFEERLKKIKKETIKETKENSAKKREISRSR